MVSKALTIAGSDCGGGAGIQADLKTFQELGVFGMSAVTAVTAQNTKGVQGVYPIPVEGIIEQLHSIEEDLRPDAIKTGMLFSSETILAVSECIQKFQWSNVIVDPVMIAKGGASLLQKEAIDSLITKLLPLAMIVTPNIPEAEVLSGIIIASMQDRERAARKIYSVGAKHVLIKGGHENVGEEMTDLLFDGQHFFTFKSNRIHTKNTHGTGCTFSSAITAELAKGAGVVQAIEIAKSFIQAAIEDDLHIGSGHGPTNHWAFNRRGVNIPLC